MDISLEYRLNFVGEKELKSNFVNFFDFIIFSISKPGMFVSSTLSSFLFFAKFMLFNLGKSRKLTSFMRLEFIHSSSNESKSDNETCSSCDSEIFRQICLNFGILESSIFFSLLQSFLTRSVSKLSKFDRKNVLLHYYKVRIL